MCSEVVVRDDLADEPEIRESPVASEKIRRRPGQAPARVSPFHVASIGKGVQRLRGQSAVFALMRTRRVAPGVHPPPWGGLLPSSLCGRVLPSSSLRCATCSCLIVLRSVPRLGGRGARARPRRRRDAKLASTSGFATIASRERAFLRHVPNIKQQETCADRDSGAARYPRYLRDGQDLDNRLQNASPKVDQELASARSRASARDRQGDLPPALTATPRAQEGAAALLLSGSCFGPPRRAACQSTSARLKLELSANRLRP